MFQQFNTRYHRDAVMAIIASLAIVAGFAVLSQKGMLPSSQLLEVLWDITADYTGAWNKSWWWVIWPLLAFGLILLVLLSGIAQVVLTASKGRRAAYFLVLPIALAFTVTSMVWWDCPILISIALLGTASTVAWILWPVKPSEQSVSDGLNRLFFAKKIAKHFEEDNPDLRRVAIFGSWGEGKTTLLELIKQQLKESQGKKFRITRVNPWKAETPEEAWKLLAKGVEEAMGPPWIFPREWHRAGVIQFLLGLIPTAGVGKQFLNAIKAQSPEASQQYVKRVNETLTSANVHLVIFVDDMERSLPEVIRGLLPVIDRLSEFQNCFFVFAIDPEQLDAVFKHATEHSAKWNISGDLESQRWQTEGEIATDSDSIITAQGYLDKVIDLQLPLPTPTQREIAKWFQGELTKSAPKYEKLRSASSELEPLLPTNPRQCMKFLRSAQRTEALFLDDYGSNEHDYVTLFILLMADAEFSGFMEEIARDQQLVANLGSEWLMSSDRGSNGNSVVSETLDRLKSMLGIKGQEREARLALLLRAFCLRAAPTVYLQSQTPFNFRWLTSGFRRRLTLPGKDIEQVRRQWQENAGESSLRNMIEDAIPNTEERPSEIEETFVQIFELELEEISDRLREASSANQNSEAIGSSLRRAQELILCFSRHAKNRKNNFDAVETAVYDKALFGKFVELVKQYPGDKTWNDFNAARRSAMLELAKSLPFNERSALPIDKYSLDLEMISDSSQRSIAATEFSKVRESIRKSILEDFLKLIQTDEEFDPNDYVFQRGQKINFLTPDHWMPRESGNYDLSSFESTRQRIRENPIAQKNFAKVIIKLFFRPLVPRFHRDAQVRLYAARLIVARPDYVRSLWDCAMAGDPEGEELRDLRHLREELISQLLPSAEIPEYQDRDPEKLEQGVAPQLAQEDIDAVFPILSPDTEGGVEEAQSE